jgi:hypothetical protein
MSLKSYGEKGFSLLRNHPLTNLIVHYQPHLQQCTLVEDILSQTDLTNNLMKYANSSSSSPCDTLPIRRSMGSMVGMVVGDSLGSKFEFLPVDMTVTEILV